MKYRKKPVVIEAFQYDEDLITIYSIGRIPEWAKDAIDDGVIFADEYAKVYIKTLEGNMLANVDDYIIQGINGELYPCKPDIFEKTYELVEE